MRSPVGEKRAQEKSRRSIVGSGIRSIEASSLSSPRPTLDVGGDCSLLQAPAHRFRTAQQPAIAEISSDSSCKAREGSHAHEPVGEQGEENGIG